MGFLHKRCSLHLIIICIYLNMANLPIVGHLMVTRIAFWDINLTAIDRKVRQHMYTAPVKPQVHRPRIRAGEISES